MPCPPARAAIAWRTDVPATLYYVEAQDGGDPKVKVDIRDKVFTLNAPFTGSAQELAALPLRFAGLSWGTEKLALVDGYRWADRHLTTWQLNPSAPATPLHALYDGSSEDTYHLLGTPYEHRNAQGKYVLLTGGPTGQSIYFLGDGASPEGDRPFVDELDLATKKNHPLVAFRSPGLRNPGGHSRCQRQAPPAAHPPRVAERNAELLPARCH